MKLTYAARGRAYHRRHGAALLSVLWIMMALVGLTLAVQLTAREAIRGALSRGELVRTLWDAEDCLARARSAMAELLEGDAASDAWGSLDEAVMRSRRVQQCPGEVSVVAAGSALDVNAAGGEQLGRMFQHLGFDGPVSDSLVDAILDWRDEDDLPRTNGAERAWYAERGRRLPRNAPIADTRELGRIRGMDAIVALGLLGVEKGRVPLTAAPLAVLASLPGMTEEALSRIEEVRGRGEAISDLLSLAVMLSPVARDSLLSSFAELSLLVTVVPDAWIVRSRGGWGNASARTEVELRVVRAGQRAAVVRRRTWP